MWWGSPLDPLVLTSTALLLAMCCGVSLVAPGRRASRAHPANALIYAGIAFELAFAAALIWLPPLQQVFGTAGLGPDEIALLAVFPFVVWGSDELRRYVVRRNRARRAADVPRVAAS